MKELFYNYIDWDNIGEKYRDRAVAQVNDAVILSKKNVLRLSIRLNYIVPTKDEDKIKSIILNSVGNLKDVEFEYAYKELILSDCDALRLILPRILRGLNEKNHYVAGSIDISSLKFEDGSVIISTVGELACKKLNENASRQISVMINEEIGLNYEITFDKEIDFLCLVVDRDVESFTDSQFDDVYNTCQEKNFRFLISNPNFEFWLLLHFDNVMELELEKIKKNEKINLGSKSSIRYIPNELRKRLGKYKKNRYDAESLVHNINKAIKNEKEFCETLPDLKEKIGSNIGLFIEELRSYR